MAGAVGDTFPEIKNTLGFDSNLTEAQLYTAYSTLLQQLNSTTSKSKLQLANAIALQNEMPLLPTYLDIVNNNFNAAVFPVDFLTKASEATQAINRWANEKTNGKIPKLFDATLDTDTRMVLLNAIYFKGAWKEPFNNWSTTEKEFTYGVDKKVGVPMMHKFNGRLKYASFGEGELLELPYKGSTQSMLLFLPNESKTSESISSAFSRALKEDKDTSGYAKLSLTDVNLILPRFKVESTYKLKPTLIEMGIKSAFSANSNFSRMTGQSNLVLSEVVHKAFVEVNEEGAEAAAVTGGISATKAQLPKNPNPKLLNFNRPFLFSIRDSAKQLTLFSGVVNKP